MFSYKLLTYISLFFSPKFRHLLVVGTVLEDSISKIVRFSGRELEAELIT